MPPAKKRKTSVIVAAVLYSVLLSPIIIYVYKFGFHISSNHARWAEMGTAMVGIYTPILAFLTLLVILAQLNIQAKNNAHQQDQDYINNCREDIHFFLTNLDNSLKKIAPSGKTIRDILHESFQPKLIEELDSVELRETAKVLNKISPEAYNYWSSIYPIVMGLRSSPDQPYLVNAIGAISKSMTILTVETCVSLDNYLWCLTNGQTKVVFEYSPLLAKRDSNLTTSLS